MNFASRIAKTIRSEAFLLVRCRNGIAAVEFALILPVLAVMLFGMIDLGRLLTDYHLVSKSVRDATRYLSRADATAMALTCATLNDASQPIIEAKNLALTGRIDGNPNTEPLLNYWRNPATITVTPSCRDNSAPTYSGFFEGVPNIQVITVSAAVQFPLLNGWVLDRGATLTFAVLHQEIHIGE